VSLLWLYNSVLFLRELSVGTATSFEKPSIEWLNLLDKSDLRLHDGLSSNFEDPVPSHFIYLTDVKLGQGILLY